MAARLLPQLVRAIEAHGAAAEWVVTETHAEREERSAGGAARAVERRVARAALFYNHAEGRGAAELSVQAHELDALPRLVARAIERAAEGDGPSWTLPPPAAPARVELADDAITAGAAAAAGAIAADIDATARGGLLAEAGGRDAAVVRAATAAERSETWVETSRGLRASFTATLAELDVIVRAGGAAARIARRRRRLAEVNAIGAVVAAGRRAAARARAGAVNTGVYDVVLRLDAIEGSASEAHPHGWFEAFAAHADGERARRGLARYLPGQPVFGAAAATGNPFTLWSDGSLRYGTRSRPFGAWGEPVRRFPLVERGVAAGVGLDAREASLRGVSPNGGVRNLVLEEGSAAADEIAAERDRPVLDVVELAWLDVNPHTGTFLAEASLSFARGAPVAGGLLRGDIYAAFAGARLARDTERAGWYRGPNAIRFHAIPVL